ncbi:hypothetical protein [Rathayibacter sp. VKM Ac-2754]|uniref:hypothetical protein n=1 Tax=Rathayibacter sp. VKM Ac-2754 TaxID=2609251 RepID=UPI001356A461|nr:hypothetical protein [Rathayibacter sp. VKM Ac-2754]MWV57732.1 hypothetical protein [Rathayibacter sp. VKM Ac-2754]
MTAQLRSRLAAASLLLPALGVVASKIALADRLPETLASHWSDTGAADDTMTLGATLALSLVMAGAAALAGIVLVALGRAHRLVLGTAGLVAGLGAATWATSVGTTLSAGSAEGAVLGPWLLVLLGGSLYAVVPALIAPPTTREPRAAVERLPLGSSETGAWSSTITGRVFALVGVALIGSAVLATSTLLAEGAVGPAVAMAVVLGGSAIVVLAFTRLRVTADRRGLRVTSRVLGIPLRRIPLADIASASTAHLRPAE